MIPSPSRRSLETTQSESGNLSPILFVKRFWSGTLQMPLIYPIVSIMSAIVLRLIPVILAWPYPVGFDTNAYYLPAMLQGVPGPIDVFKSAGLHQLILSGFYQLYSNPFLILNGYAVLIQAGLAASLYLYAHRVAGLDRRFSMLASVAFSFSLLTLRLTWDQYTMSLGLIFALVALVALASKSRRTRFWAVPLTVFAVLSNPLPAALLLLSMVVYLLLNSKELAGLRAELSAVLVGSVIFAFQQLYVSPSGVLSSSVPLTLLSPAQGLAESANGLAYLVYAGWPLLLGLLVMLKRPSISHTTIWLGLIALFALIAPILGFLTVAPIMVWWMAGFPLAVAFGASLQRPSIKSVRTLLLFGLAFSVVVAFSYVSTSPLAPSPYSDLALGFKYYMPTGYLQSTVPTSQEGQLVGLIRGAMTTLPANSTLYLPSQFYGLAMFYDSSGASIRDLGEVNPWTPNPFNNVKTTATVYTIWWSDNSGWYGMLSLPPSFELVLGAVPFALYRQT